MYCLSVLCTYIIVIFFHVTGASRVLRTYRANWTVQICIYSKPITGRHPDIFVACHVSADDVNNCCPSTLARLALNFVSIAVL